MCEDKFQITTKGGDTNAKKHIFKSYNYISK